MLSDTGDEGSESFGVGIEGSENEEVTFPAALLSLPRGLDRMPDPPVESASGVCGACDEAALVLESLLRREGVKESADGSLLFMRELVRPSRPLEESFGESILGEVGALDAGLAVDGTGEAGFDDASEVASFDAALSREVKRFFGILNMAKLWT